MIPRLSLPEELEGNALALGTGPSFDDYHLNTPLRSSARTFICGLAYKWRWTTDYVLSDITRWSNHIVPHGYPAGLTVWSSGGTLDALTKLHSDHRPAKIKEVPNVPKGLNSCFASTLLAALSQCPNVYLLGFDGGHGPTGYVRRKRHASRFVEPWDSMWVEQSDMASQCAFLPCLQRVGWDSIWDRSRIINLSSTSCLLPLLPFPESVKDQPFGFWDRYGSCIMFILPPQGSIAPSVVFDYIRRFRAHGSGSSLPRTPIILVSDFKHDPKIDNLCDGDALYTPHVWGNQRCLFTSMFILGDRHGLMSL